MLVFTNSKQAALSCSACAIYIYMLYFNHIANYNVIEALPAHDEVSTCRASHVSPEHPVLCCAPL